MALSLGTNSMEKKYMDCDIASEMLLFIASHLDHWNPSTSQEFINSFQTNIGKQIEGRVSLFCMCTNLENFATDSTVLAMESIVKSGGCEHVGSMPVHNCRVVGFAPIHIAAGIGNIELLSCLIDNHVDMYSRTEQKNELAFDLAILKNNLDCAQLLINEGFKYPATKYNLFVHCISKDNTRAAQCCLDAGVQVSDSCRMTCMKVTLERDSLSTIEWLLDKGIGGASMSMPHPGSLIAVGSEGHKAVSTPLSHARSTEMVKLLLRRGADPTLIPYTSSSPLTEHIICNHLEICELILSHFPETARIQRSHLSESNQPDLYLTTYTPIHHASWQGNVKAVDLLLKYDADCHAVTGDGNTALSLACHVDSFDCVQRFVALGCNPNVPDKDQDTALIYATFNGNAKICKLLLENGADPHARNSANVTPLWNAVYSRSLDVVEHLLQLNADFSIQSRGSDIHNADDPGIYDEEVTPVFIAIHHEEISTLKLLLAAGCYLHRETSTATDANISMYLDSWAPDNKRWLEHVTQTPLSLAWWCKKVIRSSIKSHFQNSVNKLNVSSLMKSYIIIG